MGSMGYDILVIDDTYGEKKRSQESIYHQIHNFIHHVTKKYLLMNI
jgi:hypothetical protein